MKRTWRCTGHDEFCRTQGGPCDYCEKVKLSERDPDDARDEWLERQWDKEQ